jgi:uncharacterized membrane protein YecN with MAPEG domain
MISLPITSVFATFFTVFYVGLSVRVVRVRRKNRISLGDGGHDGLLKAISTHSNFSQYIPLALFLMALHELQWGSHPFLIGAGLLLIIGRISHIIGIVFAKKGPNLYRVIGMMTTFTTLIFLAVSLAARSLA